jgi:hypothetical protein
MRTFGAGITRKKLLIIEKLHEESDIYQWLQNAENDL